MLILVLFFIIFDVFSSISINQPLILMKIDEKTSKNTSGKKGWFYSKEMLLFCWLKNWYLESFYPFADDEKAVVRKIRARSLQKQPFHHQQMITDHPNFDFTMDQNSLFFHCFFNIFEINVFAHFSTFFTKKSSK